jgi:uncharacterized membrane protein YbhN (UPF0104 family)
MDTGKLIRTHKSIKIWDIVKICLAVALLGYVASKTNFSQLLALRDRFSWGWFGVTFFLFSVMIAIKAAQYYYLINKKLPYSRVLEIVVLQNALMNFVATAAGIASYLTMLSAEKDVRLGRATISFVVVKMVDLMAVQILLLCSIFFLYPLPSAAIRIAVIISLIALLILAFFFGTILFRRSFAGLLRKLAVKFKLDGISFVRKGLDLFDALAEQDRGKIFRLITTAATLSLLYMAVTMAWGYARLRMFSFLMGIDVVTFVHSVLQIASWVPVHIFGGLGISETLSVYLFSLFGESQVELAAIMIGARLVFYIMNAFSLLYLPVETMMRVNRRKT